MRVHLGHVLLRPDTEQVLPRQVRMYASLPFIATCLRLTSFSDACDNGYYCTTDGMGNTYCCPDGMDLGACAKAYSLSVSLIKESSTESVPTASSSVSAMTTPIHITYPTATATVVPTGNATYSTSAPPSQFTGAAAKAAGAGMAVLAGAVGVVGLL